MTSDVLLVYDERMLGHNPRGWDPAHPEWTESVKALLAQQYPDKDLSDYAHPERPQRLSVVIDRLRDNPIAGTRWIAAELAEPVELLRAHTDAHVAFIEALAGRACWLSVDTTAVSPDSVTAAKLAAGAGVTAIEAILRGDGTRGFCAVRPPGHHAPADRAMGFCLYNNIAVAAEHARAQGMRRIMILDWDLHHGNGTQEIFYADPDVLFIDTHCAAPFYPGTGGLDEIGSGSGTGLNLNVPLPAGSGNAALCRALQQVILPAGEAFAPELILISAGFDGHHLDQTFQMDETGFAALTAGLCELADRTAGGRIVLCLEGGYNAESLSSGAYATVEALAGQAPGAVNVLDDDPGCGAVDRAAAFHAASIRQIARARQT